MRSIIFFLVLCTSFVCRAEEGIHMDLYECHSEAEGYGSSSYSPQVCQFSLSMYTGKIQNGSTDSFTVGLSCPQESDCHATVVAFINNLQVASKVVKIEAGKTSSDKQFISVGHEYNGNTYRLIVE